MLTDVGAPTWMVNAVAPGWADAGDDPTAARSHARMIPVDTMRRIGSQRTEGSACAPIARQR